jgi:pantoate--beta-alanine ligase
MQDRPKIVRAVSELRRLAAGWRKDGASLALVPTMGALHAGHVALCRNARSRATRTVASIFVNPTQFGPSEDFARYPRDEAADIARFGEAGIAAVFAPAATEVYPADFGRPSAWLPAEARERFPAAFFCRRRPWSPAPIPVPADPAGRGEKDYQQLVVVRRMVADLTPRWRSSYSTVREADGPALSSRNASRAGRTPGRPAPIGR